MRYAPRALLAGGLGLAACCLAACGGSSGVLSSEQAGSLSGQLDRVSASVDSGQCAAANNAANDFSNAVAGLGGVNPGLTDNLKQGAAQVSRLAALQCRTETTTSTTSSSTTSSPTSTTSSSTPTSTSTTSSSTPTSTSSATSSTDTGSTSSSGNGGAGITGGGSSGRSSGGGGIPSGNGSGNGQ